MPPRRRKVQRAPRSPRDRGGFLKAHVDGLDGARTVFFQTGVLGIRFHTEPEDLVPHLESSHFLSDHLDLSSEIRTKDVLPGP